MYWVQEEEQDRLQKERIALIKIYTACTCNFFQIIKYSIKSELLLVNVI